jgi:hypothetical protein
MYGALGPLTFKRRTWRRRRKEEKRKKKGEREGGRAEARKGEGGRREGFTSRLKTVCLRTLYLLPSHAYMFEQLRVGWVGPLLINALLLSRVVHAKIEVVLLFPQALWVLC